MAVFVDNFGGTPTVSRALRDIIHPDGLNKVTCLEEFGSLVGARLKFLRKSRPLRLFYEKMLIISSFSSNVYPHFNNLVDNLKGGI